MNPYLFLPAAIGLAASVASAAPRQAPKRGRFEVIVDGRRLYRKGMWYQSRPYIYARALFEMLGSEIGWHEATSTLWVTRADGLGLKYRVGRPFVVPYAPRDDGSAGWTVGERRPIPNAPILWGGEMMISARAAQDGLDAALKWERGSRRLQVTVHAEP